MSDFSALDLPSFGSVNQPLATEPVRARPAGHDVYKTDTYHGELLVSLQALEPVHVGTGVSVLGTDVGSEVPLVRPMTQRPDGTLIIPGTSIKGCLRSMYEAVTPSTLGIKSSGVLDAFKPNQYSKRTDRYNQQKGPEICPASQVFGAMGYQGLLSVTDGVCDSPAEIGEIPILHSPKKRVTENALPRKFYRALHHRQVQAGDEPETAAIQQAPVGAVFTTQLRFKNLSLEALGVLLIVLGQDGASPLSLKLGAAKGYGFGTVRAKVTGGTVSKTEDLVGDRYLAYGAQPSKVALPEVTEGAIAAANNGTLLQVKQLAELRAILPVPTKMEET